MASYGFGFRASTRKISTAGRLYLRVVHGGASRSVTTPYRVYPHEWDSSSRRLIFPSGRSQRGRELSEIEGSMFCDMRRMDAVIAELEKSGPYTADDLISRYRSVMTGNTFCVYTEKLAREMERTGYHRTAKAYRSTTARLRAFNGGKDLSIDQLSAPLVSDFQQSLQAEGRSMNTISFYMRTIRAIYHKSIAEGRTPRHAENLFAGVYTGVSETRKSALSTGELAVLSAYDPTAESNRTGGRRTLPQPLAQALAMFLFCYHARGMYFVDMAHLGPGNIQGDTMTYRSQKTGQLIELRILPAMKRIMEWFSPITQGGGYLFPVITDPGRDENRQYESGMRLQNQRLKKVARMCGIDKNFSTHTARHSWATVAMTAGLPLTVIAEALGHSNLKATEAYLASLERSDVNNASKVVSDALKPKENPDNNTNNNNNNSNTRDSSNNNNNTNPRGNNNSGSTTRDNSNSNSSSNSNSDI